LQSKEKLLWDAAKNGNVSFVKEYLDAGTDMNFKNPNEVVNNTKTQK